MTITKTWKVYGRDGHRQRMSFGESVSWDWSDKNFGTRILEVDTCEKTGTNDYVIVRITRNTSEECDRELSGQITDGYFENAAVGKIVEIDGNEERFERLKKELFM